EAPQREHCRLDPVRERRHQRRPEHLVPLRHLERPILPYRQRLFRRNHLHITLEQLHGQYLRHFYDTTSLLRSPSNRHLFVPRSPTFAPRPSYLVLRTPAFVPRTSYLVLRTSYFVPRTSYLVLRTSHFVPRTSYLAFVPLDLHHRTKPIVVVPVVRWYAPARRASAHLHRMPPGATARCLPLRQVRQRHAALRRPLRVDVGRNRIVPRVVPVGAPLMDVESDVDQPVTVRRRSPDLPWRVLREPPSVPVERLVAPRILRPIDASERCLLPLRLRRQPEPLAMRAAEPLAVSGRVGPAHPNNRLPWM